MLLTTLVAAKALAAYFVNASIMYICVGSYDCQFGTLAKGDD